METDSAAFPELDPSMELEQVFWHFFVKFQHLPTPRSVAEARVTPAEVEFLEHWFARQFGKPRNWCDRTWQERVEEDATASSREMFGALFLILASEVCRDRCSEDLVWPTVATTFIANKTTYSVLFANQQPTEICKTAMAAGARKLGLRNLIERDGKQEYFDTLKLQIGFTFQGATRRMPEWLDGFGHTTAVKLLNGFESDSNLCSFISGSFQDLWQTLRDFRASRIPESAASAFLRGSPWVRTSWIPELLEVTKTRRAPRAASSSEMPDEAVVEALCEPVLRWRPPEKPSLQLRLNEARVCALLAGKDTATFAVDGVVVGRWQVESGGSFRGDRQLGCQKPGDTSNLRPRRLTITSNGEPLEEVDFSDIGLAEPLLLFDTATGCKKELGGSLDPNCDYALLCDTDMMVPDVPAWRTKNRSAFFLNRPLTIDTRLLCDGTLCWQPQLSDRKPRRVIRVSIESLSGKSIALGSEAQLVIKDAPGDAEEVTLLVADHKHFLVSSQIGWSTTTPILISLEMAMGAERIRVRIKGPDYVQTAVPKLSLNFNGVAVRRSEWGSAGDPQWYLLSTHDCMNRADGDGKARIFDIGDFGLYEGPCPIETARSGTVDLRDLHGWGNPLLEASDANEGKILVGAVEDRGCVEMFVPVLFGKVYNKLYLRTPRPTANGHTIWVWKDVEAQPVAFSGSDIRVEQDGFIWEVSRIPTLSLMAVAYEGACLGAYWNLDHFAASLRRPLSAKAVALIRWLKIPILSASLKEVLHRAVARNPAEFLRGWLDSKSLTKPLCHRPAEQGVDTVVRALFWDLSARNSGRLHEITSALGSRLPQVLSSDPVENFKKALVSLGNVCPSFAYNLARTEARNEKYRGSIRSAVQEVLRHNTSTMDGLRTALQFAATNCTRLCNITPYELSKVVKLYESYLAGEDEHYPQETALRRLGESGRGREYLIAALLLECLERTDVWHS